MIIPFTNPESVGRFVFHCHVVKARRQRNDDDRRSRALKGAGQKLPLRANSTSPAEGTPSSHREKPNALTVPG